MVKIMRHLKMAERTGKMTGNSIYIGDHGNQA